MIGQSLEITLEITLILLYSNVSLVSLGIIYMFNYDIKAS